MTTWRLLIRFSRIWECRSAWAFFSLRLSGLANRVDGRSKGDFGFHFETGLTKRIGIHVRNDSFLNRTRSEVMLQFAAIRSQDGMSGFSPIIEFEIPTRSDRKVEKV